MHRTLTFSGRNLKELLRDPMSWIFGVALPLAILLIMQIILASIDGEALASVPMFAVDRFVCGVVVFGYAFFSMFTAMLLSKDRSSAFLLRLFASPMRARDYILGYTLPILPLVTAQFVFTVTVALCFGLGFTANILLAYVVSLPAALFFIGIGLTLGALLGDKAVGGISSAVVQLAALFSGMWFDLDMIGGGFRTFCLVFPFAHAYDAIRYAIAGDYARLWLPVLITVIYAIASFVLAILLFRRKMRRN